MKKSLLAMFSLLAVAFGHVGSASALECGGLVVPDDVAASLLTSQVAGYKYKISNLKTLVVHGVEAVSGDACNIRVVLDVTLERKVRRNASGNVVLKGQLSLADGGICVQGVSVADVDVSNTLNIGEAVYELVANRTLPSGFCF